MTSEPVPERYRTEVQRPVQCAQAKAASARTLQDRGTTDLSNVRKQRPVPGRDKAVPNVRKYCGSSRGAALEEVCEGLHCVRVL